MVSVRDVADGCHEKLTRNLVENDPTCGLLKANDTRPSRLTNPTDRQIPPMKIKTSHSRPHPPIFVFDPAVIRDLASGLRLASL